MRQVIRTYRRLSAHLPYAVRRFLRWYGVVTGVLAGIDIVALLLLALTLSTAVTGGALDFPVIGSVPTEALPALIVVLSIVVVAKSAANLAMQWVATRRFAAIELELGQHLFSAYITSSWVERLGRNTAKITQMANTGVSSVVSGFLLPLSTLPSLLVTAAGVVSLIVIAQPVTALVTTVYLGAISVLQFFVLGGKTRQAARVSRDSSLRVSALIAGMVASIKEITLRDKSVQVTEVVRRERWKTAQARANANFLSTVPRFVFDAAVIGGFLVTGGVALLVGGIDQSVAAIALFGIAGFRLLPSLAGFQAVVTRATTSTPFVEAVISDVESSSTTRHEAAPDGEPLPHTPSSLELHNVTFRYPRSEAPAIRDVSLAITMGTSVGIVGSSGAGKSTLVDVIIGLLTPDAGHVEVDGEPLASVLGAWRRHVGYVPQDVTLFDGTIAQNIALSWDDADIDPERVEIAARRAQLWDVVAARPSGMNSRIGERGLALSGGQRQRLGIARALYSDPIIIVMDEATSALDTATEAEVSRAIRNLHGDVTVIAIAHRLSTIRHADQVVFMKDGRIDASGTFSQVVSANDEFAAQARLAGLE